MRQIFQTRRKSPQRRILYSWPVIVILFLALGYVGRYTFYAYRNYREVEKEYQELQRREDDIASRIAGIQEGLFLLESDAGRERIIRERFDVQKDGEEVVIFIKDDAEEQTPPPSAFHSVTSFLKNLFGL
ncbi:MAG: hypothetical protein COU47_03760 [Candidatus Niyogibacteria bacterium CG10_big_fil_rev_8_21_14_0_10_46_36]|uniref:Septum formation initiator n=1 Tax=Candidatus Niyogibacteria bacterium CG10_big_fil_rev_8_21_14_0_10_46_36 TaxID=1974726 RepID=A0A2H0TCC2_9BACT|nr:MAG: hypothetical protein COU47_03760 [Candidatus Niyogibacteria bacterium CG10_big_fil_rev_8_21_14_0_10_46_36]